MYQIKCVHCFKSIEEKSVLFQLDDIMSVLDEVYPPNNPAPCRIEETMVK